MTAEDASPPRRRLRRWLTAGGVVVGLSALWWGPAALRSFAFFRVRRVEIEGARYVNPDEIVSRMKMDSTASVWDDVAPWEKRVRLHPSVRDVRIERKLPGTLLVRVTENLPVALVQGASGLVPMDAAGKSLPIDPTKADMDLPVLADRDTFALRILGDVRTLAPTLYARIGEVRRLSRGDRLFRLGESTSTGSHDVLVSSAVTAERLTDVLPVEQDLARLRRRATELDLRYRDQIVARLAIEDTRTKHK